MTNFKPGDVVQLKSGGPKMTVAEIVTVAKGDTRAHCKWFNGKKIESRNFEFVTIELVPPNAS